MPTLRLEREPGSIWKVVNEAYNSNTYICPTNTPGECFLVDPGLDAPAIEAGLTEVGLVPRAIFCTHGHFDHAGTALVFQNKYGARVYLHVDDVKTLKASNFLLMSFKRPERVQLPTLDLVTGDVTDIGVGGQTLRYRSTPGHTPGSCVLELGDTVFTGDTLFAWSMGMSQLPGEDPEMLRQSIQGLWNRYPMETVILPGHGRSTAFGALKQDNRVLLEFLGMVSAPEGSVP